MLTILRAGESKTAAPTTKSKTKPVTTTDARVCRFFFKPEGRENGDECQYAHPRTNAKCLRCGSESHNGALDLAVSNLLVLVRARVSQRRSLQRQKVGQRRPSPPNPEPRPMRRTKAQGHLLVKRRRTSLPPKREKSTLTMPRTTCQSKSTLQIGLKSKRSLTSTADGQTSERGEEFGCMADWSTSECTELKACAPVACASRFDKSTSSK